MESKEILKEFAGKLAGLSAAAKVVAIAGAVSAYSGTGHAAADTVKTGSRFITTVDRRQSDTVSDTKKEESVVAKTEIAAPKISEEVVKTLSASKAKDVAKAADAKATKVVKANVSPKILEKAALYEPKKESVSKPKYDTRFYRAPGSADTSDRPTRSSSRSSYASSSSYSSYNYNEPTAVSFVSSTSDNDAFGENASSSRSTSAASRPSRRSYRDWGRTHTNSDSYGSASKDTDSKSKTDGIGRSGVSTGFRGGVASTATASQPVSAPNFGFGTGGSSSKPTSKYDEQQIQSEKQQIQSEKQQIRQVQEETQRLRNELQIVRAENLELKGRQGGLQQQAANLQILPQGGADVNAQAPQANVVAQPVQPVAQVAVQAVQPVVQPADIPQVVAVPNAGVPPPPPPPPPPPGVGAAGQPVVIAAKAGGAVPPPPGVPPPVLGSDPVNVVVAQPPVVGAIPPPPGVPTPVPGADPNLNVIVGNGAVVPPPAPALEAMGIVQVVPEQANANVAQNGGGIPVPPPVAPKPVQINTRDLAEALFNDFEQAKRDRQKKQQEDRDKEAKANEEKDDLVSLVKGYADVLAKGSSQEQQKAGIEYSKDIQISLELNRAKAPYAFYDGLIRLLSRANDAAAAPGNANKELVKTYKSLLKDTVAPEILMAVDYFETTDTETLKTAYENCKNDPKCNKRMPDCLVEIFKKGDYCALCVSCFQKYDISLENIRKGVLRDLTELLLKHICLQSKDGSARFRASKFPEVTEQIVRMVCGNEDPNADENTKRAFEREVNKLTVEIENLQDDILNKSLNLEAEAQKKDKFNRESYVKMMHTLKLLQQKRSEINHAADNTSNADTLDKELFSVLGVEKAPATWYSEEKIEELLKSKKAECIDQTKKASLNNNNKKELLDEFLEYSRVYMFSLMSEDQKEKPRVKTVIGKKNNLRRSLLNKLKTIKTREISGFKENLKAKWDEGKNLFRNKIDLFPSDKNWNVLSQASDSEFNQLFKQSETAYAAGIKKYREMEIWPIASKLRNAVTKKAKTLEIVFDRNESELMKSQKNRVTALLKSMLSFSKSTQWILKGDWIGEFLNVLTATPQGSNVTVLQLEGEQENYVVFTNLKPLLRCVDLATLSFKYAEFSKNSLKDLRLSRVKLTFDSTKSSTVCYKEEENGILKRLKDSKVEIDFKGSNPWVLEGVRPPEAVAGGGQRQIGVGENNDANVALANDIFKNIKNKLKKNNTAGNVAGNQNNKLQNNGFLAAAKDQLVGVTGEQRNDVITELNKRRWDNEVEETGYVDVDIVDVKHSFGSLKSVIKAATAYANEKHKPLVLRGKFGTVALAPQDKGEIAEGLNGLQTPLRIAFSYDEGNEVVHATEILDTLLRRKASRNNPISVTDTIELDRITPNEKLVEVLGQLELDTVKFSNLHDVGEKKDPSLLTPMEMRVRNMFFKIDVLNSEEAWKKLLSETRVVDFSENTIPNPFRMSLTEILTRMLPKDDVAGVDDGNPPAEIKKPKLEELRLPEGVNDLSIKEILQKFQNMH